MPDLSRLLQPKSIAVIGGGAWCASVVEQCRKMGFAGPVWPVHPKRTEVGGVAAFQRLEDLPEAPDAAFIGVNRNLTIDTVRHLRERGAGGAVCFASGFREAQAETGDGGDKREREGDRNARKDENEERREHQGGDEHDDQASIWKSASVWPSAARRPWARICSVRATRPRAMKP